TALAIAPPLAAQVPTSITIFGDSFLDTGNGDILAAMLLGTDLTPSPPYAIGRASNGPVWGEYLAAALGHPLDAAPSLLGGRNYAVGTATTGLTGSGGVQIGLLAQYGSQIGTPLDPTGLYVVFGGANDLLGISGLSAAARTAAIQGSISNIGTIVSGLYAQGARNFLIPNLPDIGLAPVALGTPASPILSASTLEFNAYLTQGLAGAGAILPGANFMGLNLYQLFQNIVRDVANGGSAYGFTNATVPCLFAPVSCNTAVFADPLHPTTRAHQLIADAAYERVVNGVDVAVVPEPATVVLTGLGLLFCGVAARRKRAA
ncbi:MAG: SGNH/GDSL hydrolase family protein, partial [Gemmatimonadaceae bacterium]